jgi:hypothetical protein
LCGANAGMEAWKALAEATSRRTRVLSRNILKYYECDWNYYALRRS